MGKPSVFVSDYLDPYINLAIESVLLSLWPSDRPWLYLWRNRPSVVLGRFQSLRGECDPETLAEAGFLRSGVLAGGGRSTTTPAICVFPFSSPTVFRQGRENLGFVTNVLKGLGVRAEVNSRLDLVCDLKGRPHKISGQAFKQKKGRGVHHGTLLVDSDLGA